MRPRRAGKTRQTSISLTKGDQELIEYVKEYMGVSSQSEVLRTCLRAYAFHLQSLSKK